MKKSENINEIAAALAKAQAQILGAEKDGKNPHFRADYATLASVWDACRKALSAQGLAVTQSTDWVENTLVLETMLTHSSGQFISGIYPVQPVKADPQGFGAAMTYARRYTLMAMVGIAPEDDDAEAAMDRPQQNAHVQAAPQAAVRVQAAPGPVAASAPLDTGLAPECCGGRMMVSKYNPNEFYCPKCRAKAPRAA